MALEITAFEPFQAVRLAARRAGRPGNVGRFIKYREEPVRFRSLASLSFPPSGLMGLTGLNPTQLVPRADEGLGPIPIPPPPILVQTYFGLIGCHGVLPRHYTELVMRLSREIRRPERDALRDWLDLFQHRLTSFFHRAWNKYRFPLAYERGEASLANPDPMTLALFCLVGLGTGKLRDRLTVRIPANLRTGTAERTLAKLDDLTILHFAGVFARPARTAIQLEAMLGLWLNQAVRVLQFQGQWLRLEEELQSVLGKPGLGRNQQLGVNAIAGERVWNRSGKIRLRIGPLDARSFTRLLPDPRATTIRKTFALLVKLTRLHIGPTLDFDVQLVLDRHAVPMCQLTEPDPRQDGIGPVLGWNTWVWSQAFAKDPDDATFAGEEISILGTNDFL